MTCRPVRRFTALTSHAETEQVSYRKYHLHETEIPEGLQIFEDRLEVAGIADRREDARAFARGRALCLQFEREASNQHDPNAIRIIGRRKGLFRVRKHFIGYVPRAVAAAIVTGGYYERVVPRLLKTYVGDTGFVEVLFQVLGPKGERLRYKRVDPDSLPQAALGAGLRHWDFVDQVTYLKREKRDEEAVALLIKLVAATEEEAKRDRLGVAPWYYEQLAGIYRRAKKFDDELRILERYEAQPKAPGALPAELADQLQKARASRDARQT